VRQQRGQGVDGQTAEVVEVDGALAIVFQGQGEVVADDLRSARMVGARVGSVEDTRVDVCLLVHDIDLAVAGQPPVPREEIPLPVAGHRLDVVPAVRQVGPELTVVEHAVVADMVKRATDVGHADVPRVRV
jgi:hypothetical protein